jgi:hypothetical protein
MKRRPGRPAKPALHAMTAMPPLGMKIAAILNGTKSQKFASCLSILNYSSIFNMYYFSNVRQ